MIRSLLAASALALMMTVPASAAPAVSSTTQLSAPAEAQVQQVRDRREGRKHRHYRGNRHYRSAPRHWHRYHARPYNWQSRGCIIVGPVWFCP